MDLVIHNARVMTCDPARPGLGVIDHGAVVIRDGVIAWVGADADLPRDAARGGGNRAASPRQGGREGPPPSINAGGKLVTPGLVDCHTHAIFAGDRGREFGMRADGKTYLEIAAAGGGIAASLGPTRAATDAELAALLTARLDLAQAAGTTTIEIKTGYDLTADGEARLLRVIGAVRQGRAQRLVPTLLAHLIPPERRGDRDAFVAEIRDCWIPDAAAQGIAASLDVYCDEGAFTLDETRALFTAARHAGLAVRGHVGQFRDLGGAELVGELAGLSADHLEQVSDTGVAALARAGTVAVMLPGACVQLRLPVPPVERLRAAGVAMAIASDLNPGSSHCESLPIQLWLATTHFGMTIDEAWLGVTRHAARAVGTREAGSIFAGARGDLVIWNCDDPVDVPYRYGSSLVARVIAGGR